MRYLKRLPERHSSLWLCSPDKFVQETHLRFFQNKITKSEFFYPRESQAACLAAYVKNLAKLFTDVQPQVIRLISIHQRHE